MIRPIILLIAAVLVMGACAAPIQPRPDQLSFPDLKYEFPSVETYRLDNGMRLYLLPDHELPLVDLTVTVGGGSTLDDAGKTGISTLFAVLLESGGAGERTPQQVEDDLERMAAVLSVDRDSYATTVSMSLHSNDLQKGLEILGDLLRRPRFDAERLELSRKQLIESLRRQDDEPAAIAGRTLAEAVFGEHPFGRHATFSSVENIERSDLLQLHQTYFQPGNIWLAVSGDVEASTLIAVLNELFGDWPSSAVPALAPPPLPESSPPAVWLAEKDIPQTTILMGHRGIEKDNPDMFPLRVANYILGGGGFNSRMMREVRSNRGLAYSVYSYFQVGRVLPEMFIASSETKNASALEVVTLMRSLMQRLRDEPVSEEELSLAKESLINSFVFAFENNHSVVTRRVRLDYYDYPEGYLETYQEKIAAVTVEDVLRVAKEYLHPDRLQIVLVGRSSEFDGDPESLGLPVRPVEPDAGN